MFLQVGSVYLYIERPVGVFPENYDIRGSIYYLNFLSINRLSKYLYD